MTAKRKGKYVQRKPVKNRVQNVDLPPDGIARIRVPEGMVPVVAVDGPHVEVVVARRRQSWWRALFMEP